jgi:hypothetical protein
VKAWKVVGSALVTVWTKDFKLVRKFALPQWKGKVSSDGIDKCEGYRDLRSLGKQLVMLLELFGQRT